MHCKYNEIFLRGGLYNEVVLIYIHMPVDLVDSVFHFLVSVSSCASYYGEIECQQLVAPSNFIWTYMMMLL